MKELTSNKYKCLPNNSRGKSIPSQPNEGTEHVNKYSITINIRSATHDVFGIVINRNK
jgi:hypothetical protein